MQWFPLALALMQTLMFGETDVADTEASKGRLKDV